MKIRKERKSFSLASEYQLGILFGCGSIVTEKGDEVLVIRHKDKYFLEQVQNLFIGNKLGYRKHNNKEYYILKSKAFDYESLFKIGYKARNDSQRYLPILDKYNDFLRAYIELHGCWDYCTTHKRNKEKYYRLRLRIYGNYFLIDEINRILSEEVGVKFKSIQMVKSNNTTSYIAYTSLEEIYAIRKYLDNTPCNESYWNDVDIKIKNPRINSI